MLKKKKIGKFKKIVAGVGVALAVAGSAFWVVKDGKPVFPLPAYEATIIFDGDTFETNNKRRIRLARASAPDEGFCGYEGAKKELSRLLEDKPIYLKVLYDKEYRLYAEVYTSEGDVTEMMIKSGWARIISSPEDKSYEEAGQFARDNKLGIYGECVSFEPEKKGCDIKGNNRRGEKLYSFPGCSTYVNTSVDKDLGDEWFCDEAEAEKAGYKKSGGCFDKSYESN